MGSREGRQLVADGAERCPFFASDQAASWSIAGLAGGHLLAGSRKRTSLRHGGMWSAADGSQRGALGDVLFAGLGLDADDEALGCKLHGQAGLRSCLTTTANALAQQMSVLS